MKIILVNGKKRSGKDYFANQLQEELDNQGYSSEIMSFADPLKLIVADTFGITTEELDNYKNKSTPVGVIHYGYETDSCSKITDFRLILQRFGTEAMKPWFGEDVWVTLLLERARDLDVDFVIVPDFRFSIEDIDGSITVKIRNDDVEKNSTDDHASENELNDFVFDYTIDNSGYKDLTDDVQSFITQIV